MDTTIEQVRTAVLARLKAKVTRSTDIRELESQRVGVAGLAGNYPCVRYACDFAPDDCGDWLVNIAVFAWSEGDSSLEANRIVDEVVSILHRKAFVSGGVRVQAIELVGVPRLVRGDDRLWRGEARFSALASAA